MKYSIFKDIIQSHSDIKGEINFDENCLKNLIIKRSKTRKTENFSNGYNCFNMVVIHKFFDAVSHNATFKDLHEIISSRNFIEIIQNLDEFPVHFSPLHFAIVRRREDLVEVLLRYGARPNAREVKCNIRPIHLAVIYKLKEAVSMLVTHGADLTVQAGMVQNAILYRGTPLEMAAIGPNSTSAAQILEILEGSGTKIEKRNLKKSFHAKLEKDIQEIKTEIKEAKEIHKYLKEIEQEIASLNRSVELEDFYQLEKHWYFINSDPKNRSKIYVEHLQSKIEAMQEILDEETEKMETKSFLACPVCLEIPSKKVFNCQVCFNHLCGSCKIKIVQDAKCPSCRHSLKDLPLVQNRTLEILISRSEL